MKKVLCTISTVFIAVGVLAASVFVLVTADSRTLKSNIEYERIEIFVPSGMANEYENLLAMTFDDHRIWKYNLNDKEAQKMNEDIERGLWKEFYDTELAQDGYFFPDGYFTKDLSEELYYCMYNSKLEGPIYHGALAENRYLFLYDAGNQGYYCASKAI